MTTSQQSIALKATNPFARRRVGKREWRVTIYELIESERRGHQLLRAISDKHPNDALTQRLVADAALEAAERMSKLHELLAYGEEKPNENQNGGE